MSRKHLNEFNGLKEAAKGDFSKIKLSPDYMKIREQIYDSNLTSNKMKSYDPLKDPALLGYFSNESVKKHLSRMGYLNEEGKFYDKKTIKYNQMMLEKKKRDEDYRKRLHDIEVGHLIQNALFHATHLSASNSSSSYMTLKPKPTTPETTQRLKKMTKAYSNSRPSSATGRPSSAIKQKPKSKSETSFPKRPATSKTKYTPKRTPSSDSAMLMGHQRDQRYDQQKDIKEEEEEKEETDTFRRPVSAAPKDKQKILQSGDSEWVESDISLATMIINDETESNSVISRDLPVSETITEEESNSGGILDELPVPEPAVEEEVRKSEEELENEKFQSQEFKEASVLAAKTLSVEKLKNEKIMNGKSGTSQEDLRFKKVSFGRIEQIDGPRRNSLEEYKLGSVDKMQPVYSSRGILKSESWTSTKYTRKPIFGSLAE